jgi:hypothetical protein
VSIVRLAEKDVEDLQPETTGNEPETARDEGE